MLRMFADFFAAFLDVLAAPRRHEERVRSLRIEDLQHIASGEDSLPYRSPAVTALVWELKFRGNNRAAMLAGAFLADQVLALAGEELGKLLLIPVPMHHARRKERGFNQTELLCESVLKNLEINTVEYLPHALSRTRPSPPQQSLPKKERLRGMRGNMAVTNPTLIAGRVCVVVDDVTTTGATLAECKRALGEASARRVHTLALARS